MTTNETTDHTRTVVLHPKLADGARLYFRERASEPGATARCVELDPNHAGRLNDAATLEDLIELARGSGADIVLCPTRDEPTWRRLNDGGLRPSAARQVPRGWEVESEPDLWPIAWLEPQLDDGRGSPLLPDEGFATEVRKRMAARPSYERSGPRDSIEELVATCDAERRTPSFPLFDVVRRRLPAGAAEHFAIGDERDDRSSSARSRRLACFRSMLGEDGPTALWIHRGVLMGVGPRIDELRAIVEPHHRIATPDLDPWKQAVEQWNPYRALGKSFRCRDGNESCTFVHKSESEPELRYTELVQRVREACGVDIEQATELWSARARAHRTAPATGLARLETPACDEARALIRSWIERGFDGASDAAPILFELDLVTRAPLIELPRAPNEVCRVLANLGAGHLGFVAATHYPCEAPLGFSWVHGALDGGDVRIYVGNPTDWVHLEGTPLPAIKRRAAEAARAAEKARAAAYDDD